MTYNVFIGTLNPTHFTASVLASVSKATASASASVSDPGALISDSRSSALVTTLSESDSTQDVNVAGVLVQFADAVKLLGVMLNPTLSFDKHLVYVACQHHTYTLLCTLQHIW